MSEVTVTRCDKCEKFVEKKDASRVDITPLDEGGETRELDVCPSCEQKLLKWFGVEA